MATHSSEWPRELTTTRRRWSAVTQETLNLELTGAILTRPDRYRPIGWREWQVRRNGRDLGAILETQEGHDR